MTENATQSTWHDAGPLDGLPEATPTAVHLDGRAFLLLRRGGEVVATDLLCPHKFTPLDEGTIEDRCIRCPRHDAAFHLDTGRPRPGDEWAGHLPVYAVRVEAGRVLVRI